MLKASELQSDLHVTSKLGEKDKWHLQWKNLVGMVLLLFDARTSCNVLSWFLFFYTHIPTSELLYFVPKYAFHSFKTLKELLPLDLRQTLISDLREHSRPLKKQNSCI